MYMRRRTDRTVDFVSYPLFPGKKKGGCTTHHQDRDYQCFTQLCGEAREGSNCTPAPTSSELSKTIDAFILTHEITRFK